MFIVRTLTDQCATLGRIVPDQTKSRIIWLRQFSGLDKNPDNIWASRIVGKTTLSGVPVNVVGAGLESSGQSHGLTWSHLVSHGLTWSHMVSPGLTLVSRRSPWVSPCYSHVYVLAGYTGFKRVQILPLLYTQVLRYWGH